MIIDIILIFLIALVYTAIAMQNIIYFNDYSNKDLNIVRILITLIPIANLIFLIYVMYKDEKFRHNSLSL